MDVSITDVIMKEHDDKPPRVLSYSIPPGGVQKSMTRRGECGFGRIIMTNLRYTLLMTKADCSLYLLAQIVPRYPKVVL